MRSNRALTGAPGGESWWEGWGAGRACDLSGFFFVVAFNQTTLDHTLVTFEGEGKG